MLFIYDFSIIQTTIKFNLIKRIYLHLFYNASNIVKMFFGSYTVNYGMIV